MSLYKGMVALDNFCYTQRVLHSKDWLVTLYEQLFTHGQILNQNLTTWTTENDERYSRLTVFKVLKVRRSNFFCKLRSVFEKYPLVQ